MKKTLVALALAAVIPVAVYAAMEGQSGHQRGDRLERMTEVLNLDDSQQELIKKAFEEHKAERKAMREQMRARMDEILTPEQRAKKAELREQRSERRHERSKKRGGRYQRGNCGEEKSS
ncbi:MAG: protein CpxP [Gammaproteobacteria bacterium]|jgi:protein CpxP